MEESKYLKTIKSIAEGSNRLSTWSLSIIGGSLLAILSTSYVSPEKTCIKMFYLFFILGWFLIACSMFFGINISGRSMAAELYSEDEERLKEIFTRTNIDFKKQLDFFKWSLFVFSIWLISYLIWWIFVYIPIPKK